ncbi:MAG: hypothetical protein HKN10_11260 [Myxococcales bacterium]|nr:hypothetical protein [Myxococcales bacterium]
MIRAWAVCAAAMLVCGCQSGEEPVRGARQAVVRQPVSQSPPESSKEPREWPSPADSGSMLVQPATQKPVERDLGAELKAAVGLPIDCVGDFTSSTDTTIRIGVSAIVRPTGMCIEPSAYGSGLSSAALKCVERRVGTVVLRPLDDTTQSKTVSTVLEIDYEPPVIVEADPGTPEPELKNVVEPMAKRPWVPLIEQGGRGVPIDDSFRGWLQGGNVRHPDDPNMKKISGPKPRAIDGYEVDENAQDWR